MDCSMLGFIGLEFAQINVPWVGAIIEPYDPLSFSSPFAVNLSQCQGQGLTSESALCLRWPKYWSFTFSISPSNEYSGLISFRIWLVCSPCSPRDSQEYSSASQFESISSLALSLLDGPALTFLNDYSKTIALTIRTFVSKVMSLLFNTLSRFVITFLRRSRCLWLSWL